MIYCCSRTKRRADSKRKGARKSEVKGIMQIKLDGKLLLALRLLTKTFSYSFFLGHKELGIWLTCKDKREALISYLLIKILDFIS